MEEIAYVIKHEKYGYVAHGEYIDGYGEAPIYSDNISSAMIFANRADCSEYECYGEPKEIKIVWR